MAARPTSAAARGGVRCILLFGSHLATSALVGTSQLLDALGDRVGRGVWFDRDRLQKQGLGGVVNHGRMSVKHVRSEYHVDLGRPVRPEGGVYVLEVQPGRAR